MKQFKIKTLLLTICLLISTGALADITIDGNNYSLNISNKTAALTGSTLSDIVIPETITYDDITYTVTSIRYMAFYYENTLKTIKLSPSVKKIEAGAFNHCNLQQIDLGSVETIEEKAFIDCPNLNYIVIPQTIQKAYNIIKYSDYSYNTNLKIICLRQDFNIGYSTQTMYPSSFYTISCSTHVYDGKNSPKVTYNFNGIGSGFKPISEQLDAMNVTAGNHTGYLKCSFANSFMSFDVDIPYTYTINPAKLTAKVKDASRQYGDANPQFSSIYTGFVNNEDTSLLTSNGSYTTTATVKSEVGTYAIKQTGATAQNYVFEYEDGTLTVDKAPLTMTANDKTISYGGTIPTFDANYEGLKNNERQPVWTTQPTISTTATSTTKVGTYPITISDADAKNYQLTINNGTLTIEKADLKVIIDNKSRFYGEANPELTYYYSGLKNNETEPEWEKQPIIETTADIKSNVGTYPIRINNAVAVNYNVTATDGALTIKKCQLKVATKDYTRAYGEENPEFELFYTGFVNNEDESVLVAKPKATTTATANTDVGVYDITVSNGVAENYDFSYSGGKLTIEKAYQTLTWDQDFSDVKKFDQVELLATVSSGLDVTYSIEGEQTCIIFKIGSKQYLNCESGGEVVVAAIQEGNKNYWQTTKIYKTIVIKPLSAINGHEYVDLGLPSGKCWAYTDYGSTVPEGYGTYLNWKDNSIISSKWGSDWMTPSIEDIRELENNCTWEWSTRTGRNGYTVKGKNGNSIFLPANGCLMKGQQFSTKVGEWVYYWSSTISGDMANIMMCTSSDVWYGEMNTTMTKLPIRPITKSMNSDIRGVVASSDNNSPEIIGIYDLQGHKLDDLGKGMNIVKMSNGTTKKIFVK